MKHTIRFVIIIIGKRIETDVLILDSRAILRRGEFPSDTTDSEGDEAQPFEGANGEPLNVFQGNRKGEHILLILLDL